MNLDTYISNIQNFLNNNAAVDSDNIRSYLTFEDFNYSIGKSYKYKTKVWPWKQL